MRFIIRGNNYGVDRTKILDAVKSAIPNPTDGRHKHYVEINGLKYPIKQVIYLVTGLPYIAFTAQDAYRILTKIGFEVHNLQGSGIVEPVNNIHIGDMMKFAITLECDEDGYIVASCPALPGCHSQGRTKEEAISNITEAIRGYIASMRKHGEPIPRITDVQEVEVAV